MLKRILITIVTVACIFTTARADGFFIGGTIGVMGGGLQVGWESEQSFGVRLSGGSFWGIGYFLSGDAYYHWGSDQGRGYLGGGVTTIVVTSNAYEGNVAYVAPELLFGGSFPVAPHAEMFAEFNPGLTIARLPALRPDTFEYFPVVEIGLLIRLNFGFRIRF
jgi:hypothetical protein